MRVADEDIVDLRNSIGFIDQGNLGTKQTHRILSEMGPYGSI